MQSDSTYRSTKPTSRRKPNQDTTENTRAINTAGGSSHQFTTLWLRITQLIELHFPNQSISPKLSRFISPTNQFCPNSHASALLIAKLTLLTVSDIIFFTNGAPWRWVIILDPYV